MGMAYACLLRRGATPGKLDNPLQVRGNTVKYTMRQRMSSDSGGGSTRPKGRKYRPLAHTADVGWRLRGGSLEELFAHAAQALTAFGCKW